MIFVTTGVTGAPFDRLLRVVDDLPTDEEIIVQHGPSSVRPRRARCVSFLPFAELTHLVDESSLVITHAGAGSVLVALSRGKRPLVVPRLPQYGELVDDHQLRFARHLAAANLADVVEEPEQLPKMIPLPANSRPMATSTQVQLVSDLSAYLHSVCSSGANGRHQSRDAIEVPR
jgi:UDP-N-acetylglucosamine transferase subunit ALG13